LFISANHQGLTANWEEPGLHYSGKGGKPSNPLLMTWNASYEQLPDNPIRVNINGQIESP